MYYPNSPQLLHEMVINFMLSTNDIFDSFPKNDTRIILSPDEAYVYVWTNISSWYNYLANNKNLNKFIIIWNSNEIKWIWTPNISNYMNLLWNIRINSNLKEKFCAVSSFELIEKDINMDSIDCQLPFLLTSKKLDSILPIFIWYEKNYIKLVNLLKDSLEKDESLGIIFSSNLYDDFKNKTWTDKKLSEAIVDHDLKKINNSVTNNLTLLKTFSLLSKKMNRDIVPLIYSHSRDLWMDKNTAYFSMIS